ncbi:hypothetical protein ACH4VX_07180 [Streptomyces sp. NPDC020731]|uniref:hypothetical protein n=1 Tax=Streptomyces sp. NPDC020731 TaxID=3365085 RepID=UPI00379B6E2A
MQAKPVGGCCRISDADLADIRRAVKDGLLTPEEATEEERKGVLRQREDIGTPAGGAPVKWYEDNNLSAFKRNVKRPGFEQMIRDLVRAQVLRAGRRKQVPEAAEPRAHEDELEGVEEEIADLQALWRAKKVKAGTRSTTEELLASGWENLSIERQRIIVRKVLRAVLIHPARSRGGRSDPARVEPVSHTA